MAEIQRGEYYIEEIAAGTYKIYERRDASMYLVCGGERACLIDTAYGLRDLKELAGSLTRLPVTVINTHGHVDHVLGNRYFGKAYMHPADRPLYEEIVSGCAEMLKMPWVRDTYGDYIDGIDPASVRFPDTEDIKDGDVIDLGGRSLEVIEMPGHTPGSVMLLDRAEKICFSGDSIIEHLWLFLEESLPPETYLRSLRRAAGILREAGTERVYNGHFSYNPLTPADADAMLAGMERVCAGDAEGRHFENAVGSGNEYDFGKWSVLCRGSTDLPA